MTISKARLRIISEEDSHPHALLARFTAGLQAQIRPLHHHDQTRIAALHHTEMSRVWAHHTPIRLIANDPAQITASLARNPTVPE